MQLTKLLQGNPIDLNTIVGEIRERKSLESLAKKLASSLDLVPDGPELSIDQAVALLGADRLRVLVYMWSRIPGQNLVGEIADGGNRPYETERSSGLRFSAAQLASLSPEAMYLECFLHCIGLDSQSSIASDDRPKYFVTALQNGSIADLRELLLQDFFLLLPVLNRDRITIHASL